MRIRLDIAQKQLIYADEELEIYYEGADGEQDVIYFVKEEFPVLIEFLQRILEIEAST